MTEIIGEENTTTTTHEERIVFLDQADFSKTYNEIADVLIPHISEEYVNALRIGAETVADAKGDWLKNNREACNLALNLLALVAYDTGNYLDRVLISMGVLQVSIDPERKAPRSTVEIGRNDDGIVVAKFRSDVQDTGMQAFDLPVTVSDEAYAKLLAQGKLRVATAWHPAINPETATEVRYFVDSMGEAMGDIQAGKYDA